MPNPSKELLDAEARHEMEWRVQRHLKALRKVILDAAMEGVVLTIDREPCEPLNGRHMTVGCARPARGYY